MGKNYLKQPSDYYKEKEKKILPEIGFLFDNYTVCQ